MCITLHAQSIMKVNAEQFWRNVLTIPQFIIFGVAMVDVLICMLQFNCEFDYCAGFA